MTKTYYAGMEIDAPCGRCKEETRHRVLSVTAGVPETLICVRCNSTHKFRLEREKAGNARNSGVVRPGKATMATPKRAASPSHHFQTLMITEQAGAIAKPYGQGIVWETGMWLDHPTFGLGKIQHKTGRKIDVLFQSGLKTLMAL